MKENEELETLFYIDDSTIHGKGLYAKVSISPGDYLGTYDGPSAEDDGMHVLWVEEDDGEWRGRDGKNLLRYLNHSEEPFAEFNGFDLYALKPIEPGIEITIHYGEET